MATSARYNSLTECCTWWLNSPGWLATRWKRITRLKVKQEPVAFIKHLTDLLHFYLSHLADRHVELQMPIHNGKRPNSLAGKNSEWVASGYDF